ncbi:MAG: acyl-CoA thioesterase [Gammaproteobacteria bacterium]|nr:acyl-CoA thioesterase [Gammaproteobacteria bacterium]
MEVYKLGNEIEEPKGELALRTLAMPADANPAGDIFGGWLLAQMDIAGGISAKQRARVRVATVAINSMTFHKPVHVGDVLCCYTNIERVGTTSITIRIQAWVVRQYFSEERIKVTEGEFSYVAIDEDRRPCPLPDQ